jgi:RNA recognition motif-containing protein
LKTILVSNLNASMTEQTLRDLFAPLGCIEHLDFVSGQEFVYVRMMNDQEARVAIKTLNGTLCSGSELVVSEARSRREREFMIAAEEKTGCIV